MSENLH